MGESMLLLFWREKNTLFFGSKKAIGRSKDLPTVFLFQKSESIPVLLLRRRSKRKNKKAKASLSGRTKKHSSPPCLSLYGRKTGRGRSFFGEREKRERKERKKGEKCSRFFGSKGMLCFFGTKKQKYQLPLPREKNGSN